MYVYDDANINQRYNSNIYVQHSVYNFALQFVIMTLVFHMGNSEQYSVEFIWYE